MSSVHKVSRTERLTINGQPPSSSLAVTVHRKPSHHSTEHLIGGFSKRFCYLFSPELNQLTLWDSKTGERIYNLPGGVAGYVPIIDTRILGPISFVVDCCKHTSVAFCTSTGAVRSANEKINFDFKNRQNRLNTPLDIRSFTVVPADTNIT
eukprot:Tbor_TRINITY_DN642_c0_g1::TRINITY_DN642_c0_g1_i1::g.1575::m.1575